MSTSLISDTVPDEPRTVKASIKIENKTKFNFVTRDKGFTWGRMCNEQEELHDIGSGQTYSVCVQGRDNSPSGVTGWFKYRLTGIGEFTVNFDCPFIGSNSSDTKITNFGEEYIINSKNSISDNNFTFTITVTP